ncbi:MAG: alpha/beta hydrolase [Bacteroidetes bacterium]|nr:alpha/beta hydrolase [Bacteroidota bacterium]
MKTLVSKILLLIFIFAQLTTVIVKGQISIEKDRNVVWLHGLDGDEGSWEHYEQIFSAERKMRSYRFAYNTAHGVGNSTHHVKTKVDQYLGASNTNSRNLVIGHSMGGIVSRNLDRTTAPNLKRFGGIITVTSSNYGAYIANSLLDGSVEQAYNTALDALVAPFLAEGQTISALYPSMSGAAVNYVLGPLAVSQLLNNDLNEYFGTPVTNNDLKVGSSVMNSINNFQSTLPRISMWVNEQSPVHWRLFGSHLSSKDGDAPKDQPFVTYMSLIRRFYLERYNAYLGLSILAASSGNWFGSAAYSNLATKYLKGYKWIVNSEMMWATLIKSYKVETYTYTVEQLVCDLPYTDFGFDHQGHGDDGGSNCQWVTTTITRNVIVQTPSDGLIPKESQILTDIPSGNVYEIKNANHFSVRNMSYKGPGGDNTRRRFNDIFNRQENDFFFIPQ